MNTAICIGGLGRSQMSDVLDALHRAFANPLFPLGNDQYLHIEDMVSLCLNTTDDISLIGHSFGADSVIQIANRLRAQGRAVKYVAVLDPVGQHWQDLTAPQGVTFDWFRRSMGFDFSFTKRAWVYAARPEYPPVVPIIIPGGHNGLPHKQEVIDRVVKQVTA